MTSADEPSPTASSRGPAVSAAPPGEAEATPEQQHPSVLRQVVGRLFGFDREIEDLRERVKELSWDTAYGSAVSWLPKPTEPAL